MDFIDRSGALGCGHGAQPNLNNYAKMFGLATEHVFKGSKVWSTDQTFGRSKSIIFGSFDRKVIVIVYIWLGYVRPSYKHSRDVDESILQQI